MKNILLVAVSSIFLLTACDQKDPVPVSNSFVTGETNNMQAQQIVFQAQSYYNGALVAETAYDKLPLCPQAKPLCSDAAVKKKVRLINKAAWVAIQEAQKAARTPGFGDEKLNTYLTSAKALTKAFTDIAATLPAK